MTMSIRKDYSIDVIRLLENLKRDIDSKRAIGRIVFGLDKVDLGFQVEQIKALMPRDLKDAASLSRETERMLASAEEESAATLESARAQAQKMIEEAENHAALIIQQAELKAQQLVAEDEISRIAKAQAEEVRRSAEKDAREMKRGADHYAADVLTNLETVVGRVLSTVEKGKRELEQQIAPLESNHAVVEVERERARV